MKKIISIILLAAMLLGMNAMADDGESYFEYSFWAKESILKARDLQLLTFGGDFKKPISREDFCEIIYNYIKMLDEEFVADNAEPFADTDDANVAALYSLGIVNGKSETKFAPNDTLTREEAATILSRVVEKFWGGTGVTLQLIRFADADKISDWSSNGIQLMYKLGIMQGVGVSDEKPIFSPKTTLTAEQAITTVVRLYEKQPVKTFADKMNALMPENQNYMFSPFSIKTALMMAANGASGETQREILDTLGVSDIEEYNQTTKQMIENFNSLDVLKLNVANSIWINSDETPQRFSKTYSDKMTDVFGATSDVVNNENAMQIINGWVSEKTNGKIPMIIKDTDFSSLLVNAVYFKAKWNNEFRITEKDIFTERGGEEKNIDFMRKTEYMQYADKDGVKIVRIPYRKYEPTYDENGESIGAKFMENADINMYVMMSDDAFDAEKTLLGTELKNTYVELSMPKFKIEYDMELNDVLQTIGIKKAYDEEAAEFQDMVTIDNFWIKKVIHKTYIDVNEKETEAAAATGISGGGGGVPPEPIVVKFNKPFTFVIRDDVSGEILFMGEYAFAK